MYSLDDYIRAAVSMTRYAMMSTSGRCYQVKSSVCIHVLSCSYNYSK